MADPSFYTFVSTLAGASVSGVKKRYGVDEAGPRSVQTAQMPCQWVQIQGIGAYSVREEPLHAVQPRGSRVFRASLVVALTPVVQGLDGDNLKAAYKMVDAVYDGLSAIAGNLGRGYPTIDAYLTPDLRIGEDALWGVIANVEVLA
jgi:hypothetical protein